MIRPATGLTVMANSDVDGGRLPLALSAARQLSAALDGLQHLSEVPARVWEVIWAELHMTLRERMGREASPSAAVLDSQSVKSAEKGSIEQTGSDPQRPWQIDGHRFVTISAATYGNPICIRLWRPGLSQTGEARAWRGRRPQISRRSF
jgi:hypothetical protein